MMTLEKYVRKLIRPTHPLCAKAGLDGDHFPHSQSKGGLPICPLVRMARHAIQCARLEAADAYERATAALSDHKAALNRASTLDMWLEVYEDHFGKDEGGIAISMHAHERLERVLGIAEENDDDE